MKVLETYVRLCYDRSMTTDIKEFIKKIKADFLVLGVIFIAALLTWVIPMIRNDRTGSDVIVLRDGKEVGRYSLSEDDIFTIWGDDESYNLILVNDGAAKVTDADCPDKLCVRQRSISKNGESIICLPHKLVITIDSPEESDLDAVTN